MTGENAPSEEEKEKEEKEEEDEKQRRVVLDTEYDDARVGEDQRPLIEAELGIVKDEAPQSICAKRSPKTASSRASAPLRLSIPDRRPGRSQRLRLTRRTDLRIPRTPLPSDERRRTGRCTWPRNYPRGRAACLSTNRIHSADEPLRDRVPPRSQNCGLRSRPRARCRSRRTTPRREGRATTLAESQTSFANWTAAERYEIGWARLPSFFATHPTSPERSAIAINRAISLKWTRAEGVAGNRPADYYEKIDGLIIGDDPAGGLFDEENRFVHPELQFSIRFPQGWETMNSQQAVRALSPRRDAQAELAALPLGGNSLEEVV